jgi:hypothetical protein
MTCMKNEQAVMKELKRLKNLMLVAQCMETRLRLRHKTETLEWVLCRNAVLEP